MPDNDTDPELIQLEAGSLAQFHMHQVPTAHPNNAPVIVVLTSLQKDGTSIVEFSTHREIMATKDPTRRKWVRDAIDDMIKVLQENRRRVE